ncbi:hypothetical protein MIND_00988300 [Mycena indigotica]|uniref:Uncharacterized protein n=1 Tax=Mycena indigotica TaxID=2126181 RepID=A0A8H6VZI8_9AGAR|nr:uncharacterized protein MIND_00988300 [Mycena indigotica]KAF7297541.1 hypothetical protein MIND_00988300 [Mycena indigotica]
MTDLQPRLPPELERQIFAMAAALYPSITVPLLLVARRVLIWIEPTLYASPILEEKSHLDAFLRIVARNPEMARGTVRQVILPCTPGTTAAQDALRTALSACKRLDRLAVGSCIWSAALLADLSAAGIRLTRFAGHVTGHVTGHGTAGAAPFSSLRLLFGAVTHLEVFDELRDATPLLTALPCLTHIAISMPSIDGQRAVNDIMRSLPHLQVFCIVWSINRWSTRRKSTSQFVFTDARVVMCLYEEWFDAIVDGPSYWELAEGHVAKKVRREIPDDESWASVE